MRANEWRIGNWVERKETSEVIKIIVISQNTVRTNRGILPYNCLQPIPLTEEWLLKFGFTLTSIGGYFNIENKDELLYIFINKDSCGIAIENKYADDDESEELSFNIKIQHVHQLQNLYFALTGEELTLQS